jgi:hypothetical protein
VRVKLEGLLEVGKMAVHDQYNVEVKLEAFEYLAFLLLLGSHCINLVLSRPLAPHGHDQHARSSNRSFRSTM